MALLKDITLDSGIVVGYHRISSVTITTNVQNVITVISYTSLDKRNEEMEWLANQRRRIELMNKLDNGAGLNYEESQFVNDEQEAMNVFMISNSFVVPYDESADIASAYSYLKTLPEFAGSLDI